MKNFTGKIDKLPKLRDSALEKLYEDDFKRLKTLYEKRISYMLKQVNSMGDKIFVMNFKNEQIGYVQRKPDVFEQELHGIKTFHKTLPRIMQYIAPEPTQFPAAQEVLDYYKMGKLDVWEYLKKSNGIKSSRDIWFMAEPKGEAWLPLIVGMQRYPRYESWFKTGDKVKVDMAGRANINRHSMELFPECIVPYLTLTKDDATRFSTAEGVVYDLRSWPSTRGLIGRIIMNF